MTAPVLKVQIDWANDGDFSPRVYRDACLALSPVAYWRLGEASGASAADATGNGHTGTYAGSPTLGVAGLLAGDSDTAATFTAAQSMAAAHVTTFDATNAFSVAQWVSDPTGLTSWSRLWTNEFNDGQAQGVRFHYANVGGYGWWFGRYRDGAGDELVVPTPASPHTHFVVCTYDGAYMRIYDNAVLVAGPMASSKSVKTGTQPFSLGTLGYAGTQDEAAIWSRALTAGEIASLYAAGCSTTNDKDVTAGLMAGTGVTWERGRSADFSAEAMGAATFVFNNEAGVWSPASCPRLLPGKPVLITSTYSAVERGHFFGYIERVAPDAWGRTVTVTCYDPLRRLAEMDVAFAPHWSLQRSCRDVRSTILEDAERGNRNLLANCDFEVDTTGWVPFLGAITRVTTDHPSNLPGTCSADFAWASGSATVSNILTMTPYVFAGQIYRFSIYMKVSSGTAAATIGLGEDAGFSAFAARSVTVTTAWQRFSMTYTTPTGRKVTSAQALRAYVGLAAAGTVRIACATVTRGQALYPYSGQGTGRWPNWCANGGFDGESLIGWVDGWTNLVGNPSFETNTSGWSVSLDNLGNTLGWVAADSITRYASDPKYGSARADFVRASGGTACVNYPITGTFKAGVTYIATIWGKRASQATLSLLMGSNGTVADRSVGTVSLATAIYYQATVTWVPSADRTDVHLGVACSSSGTAVQIDGAMVTRRTQSFGGEAGPVNFAAAGPGGGGSFVTASYMGSLAKYGWRSHKVDTPTTANAGRFYDFSDVGCYFVGGRPYTLTLDLLGVSVNMPYKVGIGANVNGTWDEAYVTGTAVADTWTNVTVAWTPSADRSALTAYDVGIYIYQTDATARSFQFDGVRVAPGTVSDSFEMAQWDLSDWEPDYYPSTAHAAGTALSILSELNGLSLSRHYIRPLAATPWYQYVTSSRADLAAKTSVETFSDDMQDFTAVELDRAAIVNIVPVTWSGGTEYYSDEDSVELYGARPTGAIGNAIFFTTITNPDVVGPALVARYRTPRARPTMTIRNRFTSQLVRELDDRITATCTRAGVIATDYLIVRAKTSVTAGGKVWTTVYGLEEYPV